ncbi:hypothetical protein I6F36_31915 [Bradyrhizobium sp. BRP19]|uniref:hypothetical protein n=1 Tax=Bradyrhizobium sp. BRP19 TaxID=2793823 RepID=UPI001CD4562B|nr:hypothetical protein [Bradyrhizobium sp. BRP19]MCA1551420.1 hypothetical protein [Bradyrhizobium sp. BRP19]
MIIESASTLGPCGCGAMTKIGEDVRKRLDVMLARWPKSLLAAPPDHPQFEIGPIGVRVQHGPKPPPL